MALGLWLCLLAPALWVASQDSCHPNGAMPAPEFSLNASQAHVGDWVTMRCLILDKSQVNRVIFCKDGQEIGSQQFNRNKFSQDFAHLFSGLGDTGNFSCRYQHRTDNNELVNSNLSNSRILSLRVADNNLYLVLGILVPCVLLLGLGLLLLHRVSSSWRRPREQSPSSGGRSAGAGNHDGGSGGGGHIEDQLHYAAISQFHHSRTLPPRKDDMVTYAALR